MFPSFQADKTRYALLDGTHFNAKCCFDYGNAEPSGRDTGNGHIEALYFGDMPGWGSGAGSGPWVMADFENGVSFGLSPKKNQGDPSVTARFQTGMLKGRGNEWAIRGAGSETRTLQAYYTGARPAKKGYNPMKKEGLFFSLPSSAFPPLSFFSPHPNPTKSITS